MVYKKQNCSVEQFQYARQFFILSWKLKDNQNQLLMEMSNQQHYQAKGRLPYSSQLIRLAMLVRYTSFQAYKLLQEHFPLPSLALLSKLRKVNMGALKACSYLRESGKISQDITVMVDEMYLRKCALYSKGKLIGCDEEGDFYKDMIVFMIQGLKTLCRLRLKVVL